MAFIGSSIFPELQDCHLDRSRSRGAQRASEPAAEILSVAKELDPENVPGAMPAQGILPKHRPLNSAAQMDALSGSLR